MLYITALSAAALTSLAVMLSLKIVSIRQKENISVGDGDNDQLFRAIRSHANLIEHAPLGIILIACAEINGVHRLILALLAIAFVVGRFLHPVGMRDATSGGSARVLGMQLTLSSMLALAIMNILGVVWALFN